MSNTINAGIKSNLEARIAAAETILAPYRADMDRQWREQDGPAGDWTPGIADRLARAYCYALTGFANYRTRPESHGWYWLAREARAALHIADGSDDVRRWCDRKVADLEYAAQLAQEIGTEIGTDR